MSERFWRVFGYDPAKKKHLAAEWQDMIFPEDLQVALQNFEAHCADPSIPYDQNVRSWHKDGSTVWVRCRGIVVRDDDGTPTRMLGAHTDITALKEAEREARELAARIEQTSIDLMTSNEELARASRFKSSFPSRECPTNCRRR